jgi:hypothetical protein
MNRRGDVPVRPHHARWPGLWAGVAATAFLVAALTVLGGRLGWLFGFDDAPARPASGGAALLSVRPPQVLLPRAILALAALAPAKSAASPTEPGADSPAPPRLRLPPRVTRARRPVAPAGSAPVGRPGDPPARAPAPPRRPLGPVGDAVATSTEQTGSAAASTGQAAGGAAGTVSPSAGQTVSGAAVQVASTATVAGQAVAGALDSVTTPTLAP